VGSSLEPRSPIPDRRIGCADTSLPHNNSIFDRPGQPSDWLRRDTSLQLAGRLAQGCSVNLEAVRSSQCRGVSFGIARPPASSPENGRLASRPIFQQLAYRKLRMLHNAQSLADLRLPPGNRLENLSGDRVGQHSIRIDERWRICFVWRDGDAHKVEIVDYREEAEPWPVRSSIQFTQAKSSSRSS